MQTFAATLWEQNFRETWVIHKKWTNSIETEEKLELNQLPNQVRNSLYFFYLEVAQGRIYGAPRLELTHEGLVA